MSSQIDELREEFSCIGVGAHERAESRDDCLRYLATVPCPRLNDSQHCSQQPVTMASLGDFAGSLDDLAEAQICTTHADPTKS